MSEHIDCECDSCATVPRAWLVARVEQLLKEVNALRARVANILARGIMRDAIDEREAQRVKREGTEE